MSLFRIFNLRKDRTVPASNPLVRKPRQPMLQSLEPRRLMSLTGAMDFPTAQTGVTPPPPITHSFGFEPHLNSATGFGGGGGMARLDPDDFAGNSGGAATFADVSAIEARMAQAIGSGTPFATTGSATSLQASTAAEAVSASSPLAASIPAASDAVPARSLSELYGTLSISTVAQIDQANIPATSVTADTQTAAIAVAPGLITAAPMHLPVMEKTVAVAASGIAVVASPAGLLDSAPKVAAGTSLPGWTHDAARFVEAEMMAVGAIAREVASQLGRDIAIEIAHLESDLAGVGEQMIAPWDHWRLAALTGAAVATAAYLQSEANREKNKSSQMFSQQLISVVPTPA